MKRFTAAALTALVAVALTLGGCATKKKAPSSFLDEVASLSKEQVLAHGDALAAKKHWEAARRYYSFLADSFPNDPLGRHAALKVADTFYAQRDSESLTEAQLRYKDFSNRFPSDPNRAYALLMLAKCSYAQEKGPQHDLTHVREAVDSLKQVLQLFPNSPDAPEARTILANCLEDLGQHELLVARYYYNVKAYLGARARLEYLLDNYPTTTAAKDGAALLEKVREHLGEKPAASRSPTTESARPRS
jgi:outer membrane assembly lipoprotein YfiO